MRAETAALNVAVTATTGTPRATIDLTDKWVQIAGVAGGATFRVEGTLDGTNWVASGLAGVGPNITANGIYSVPEWHAQTRINRTVLGTGTPTATLFGRDGRTT